MPLGMHLLFVHDRFGAMAGAEVNLLATARALNRRGHVCGILHGPGTGRAETEWRETFPNRFPITPADPYSATLIATDEFPPDVIYVHKLADLPVLSALAECTHPVLRMVHDHDLYCMRSYKYFPLTRKVCERGSGWRCIFPCGAVLARARNHRLPFKWISFRAKQQELALNRRFTKLIVGSTYMREELLRNGFAPGQIELHPPVPQAPPPAPPPDRSGRNLILYAGQVIRGKGVDVLLRSLALLRVPFECVILGDGSHRPHCEALCRKLGLRDRVRFCGYLPPEKVQSFYSLAAVSVVPSVWPEPFGAVGLEAMRNSLPVVAFDSGGIRDWLEHGKTGFMVPWMDHCQFAARLEQLLLDTALAQRLGANGRRRAEEKFGFDLYIDRLEALFHQVTRQSSLAPAQ